MNEIYIHFSVYKSTTACRLTNGVDNIKSVKLGKLFRCKINKYIGCNKITPAVKSALNDWIIKHPYVIVSPIRKNCVKMNVLD